MNNTSLKPCPFCGDEPNLFKAANECYYQCSNCGCIGPNFEGDTAEIAWNTRYTYEEID